MSKPFKSGLAPETSERIYKELLNVGTPTARKTTVRGKLNKRPVFNIGKQKGHEQDSDLLPLEFYNFHYNATPRNGTLRDDESGQDLRKQHNTSPCPSVEENVEEDSMVKMLKIRAKSANVRNPECYRRNPEFFMSCTPTERRTMGNQKPVVWNNSHQALRFNKEWTAKAQTRATRRHSEFVKHRTDKMYILNGAALSLENRYKIPDGETQYLKELSLARQELKNELQEAKEIHNMSRSISSLRSRSRTENVKLPRLSAKSKDLVADSNSMGMTMPHVLPSNSSNPQNKGFARKGSGTRRIFLEGPHHHVDQQNDEIKAEKEKKDEQRSVAGDGDGLEHTAVDEQLDNTKLASGVNQNHPLPEGSTSCDSDHIDPEDNDEGVNNAANDYTAPYVDLADNMDIEMTGNADIDATESHNGDPTTNNYDEETEAALQFYGELENEDDNGNAAAENVADDGNVANNDDDDDDAGDVAHHNDIAANDDDAGVGVAYHYDIAANNNVADDGVANDNVADDDDDEMAANNDDIAANDNASDDNDDVAANDNAADDNDNIAANDNDVANADDEAHIHNDDDDDRLSTEDTEAADQKEPILENFNT